MRRFSKHDLQKIIEMLEQEGIDTQYDYTSLIECGFTRRDILAFTSLIWQIKRYPQLTIQQVSDNEQLRLIARLGGLPLIKSAMGIGIDDSKAHCEKQNHLAKDHQAAVIGAAILADRYQILNYDMGQSILTLRCIEDSRVVMVEVRCLASELKHHEHAAFCLDVDLPKHHTLRTIRKIIDFSSQLERCAR